MVLVLMFLALACFVLAAVGVSISGRINLMALGLAIWVASILAGALMGVPVPGQQ